MTSASSASPHRRTFLKSAAATISLPALESALKLPSVMCSAETLPDVSPANRLVCIGNSFGMYQPQFFPKEAGHDYAMTPLLAPLARHRDDFTVFSNFDHGIKGGHFSVHSFLSGVRLINAKQMPNGNISLDQRAAEVIGSHARFPSLTVGSAGGLHGGCSMSWTRTGVRVPPIPGPRELFRKLFVNEDAIGQSKAADQFRLEGSILDAVLGEAKSLDRRVSGRDREKLKEYFSSIRDVERHIQQQERWHSIPKPKATIDEPVNENLVDDIPDMYELIAIALETDSTRIATLELAGAEFATQVLGLKKGYHALSHHGKDPDNIAGLVKLETYQMTAFAKFLDRLKSTQGPRGRSLLDETTILFGSGMGNANAHTNTDLPIILAGGGYRLGEHRILPAEKPKRIPLCNLYLSLLQNLGIEDDSFGTSTGTLSGLVQA